MFPEPDFLFLLSDRRHREEGPATTEGEAEADLVSIQREREMGEGGRQALFCVEKRIFSDKFVKGKLFYK